MFETYRRWISTIFTAKQRELSRSMRSSHSCSLSAVAGLLHDRFGEPQKQVRRWFTWQLTEPCRKLESISFGNYQSWITSRTPPPPSWLMCCHAGSLCNQCIYNVLEWSLQRAGDYTTVIVHIAINLSTPWHHDVVSSSRPALLTTGLWICITIIIGLNAHWSSYNGIRVCAIGRTVVGVGLPTRYALPRQQRQQQQLEWSDQSTKSMESVDTLY